MTRLGWWLWFFVLVAWTAALVAPIPQPDNSPLGEWILSRRFVIAKTLHVLAYAVLAGGAAWLRPTDAWRWLLPGLLLLHGGLTELAQSQLVYRDGTVRDFLLNSLGIAVGWAVIRWLRPPRQVAS